MSKQFLQLTVGLVFVFFCVFGLGFTYNVSLHSFCKTYILFCVWFVAVRLAGKNVTKKTYFVWSGM